MERRPRIIAHRGLWMTAPGNSLEALAHAAELGAEGVEVDVRRSADGQPILFHDRVTGDDRPVASLTRDELAAAIGHPVTTLDEALESCDLPFWDVEMKTWDAWPQVSEILQSHCADREFLLSSFRHDEILRHEPARAFPPGAVRVGAIIAHRPADMARFLHDLEQVACGVLVCEMEAVSRAFVRSLRAGGVDCFAYNVNCQEDHDLCARCGVEGVITDFPQLFVREKI